MRYCPGPRRFRTVGFRGLGQLRTRTEYPRVPGSIPGPGTSNSSDILRPRGLKSRRGFTVVRGGALAGRGRHRVSRESLLCHGRVLALLLHPRRERPAEVVWAHTRDAGLNSRHVQVAAHDSQGSTSAPTFTTAARSSTASASGMNIFRRGFAVFVLGAARAGVHRDHYRAAFGEARPAAWACRSRSRRQSGAMRWPRSSPARSQVAQVRRRHSASTAGFRGVACRTEVSALRERLRGGVMNNGFSVTGVLEAGTV